MSDTNQQNTPKYVVIDACGMRHEVDELPDWVGPGDTVLTNHWIAIPPPRLTVWDRMPWSRHSRLVRQWRRAAGA